MASSANQKMNVRKDKGTKYVNEKPGETSFKKIIKINFLIFLSYYIVCLAMIKFRVGYDLLFVIIYPLQALINFILAAIYFTRKENKKAMIYFIASLLIILVGFGTCLFTILELY